MLNAFGLSNCTLTILAERPEIKEAAFNTLKAYYKISYAWAGELQARADLVAKGNIAAMLPATFAPDSFVKSVADNATKTLIK
jgi:hypothetical protein